MDTLARLMAMAMVVTFMLQLGLSVAPGLLHEQLKRPGKILRDVLFFVVAQPLLAFVVVLLFQPDFPTVVALVVLSVVGVAPLSTRSAQKATGDAAQAIALTLVLGLVTVFTAPPTARRLLAYEGELQLHPASLVLRLLALQVAPLALGFVLRGVTRRAPLLARIVGWINIAALIGVLLLIVVPRLPALATLGWQGALAGVAFSGAAAALGLAFGGANAAERRTLAALANRPNVALALAIIAAAKAAPVIGVTVLGMFLLRALVAAIVQRLLARRAAAD